MLPLLSLLAVAAAAQTNPLTVALPERVTASPGTTATAVLHVSLSRGHHVNSTTPSDEFLIPLSLTWEAAPLEVEEVVYPEPTMETYAFSGKPLSIYTSDFDIQTRFRVPANAPSGNRVLTAKLRYQACTDRLCLPPKTIDVRLPVRIE